MRYPAVAGQFYEAEPRALGMQIDGCSRHRLGPGEKPAVAKGGPRTLRGLVVPHAGYVYSGPVAAHAYAALARDGPPPSFVILGPNHTGLGARSRRTSSPIATSTASRSSSPSSRTSSGPCASRRSAWASRN